MIRIRSIFLLVFASVFAIAVLSTGCGDSTPKEEVNVVKDSTGPTPPPPFRRLFTTTKPQGGTITIVNGAQSIKVSLSTYVVTGTVSSDSCSNTQIVAGAPVQISSITPANPWQMPTTGITDQPVMISVGDTVSIRR